MLKILWQENYKRLYKPLILLLIITLVILFNNYPLKPAYASGITAISDTMSRMQKSPATSSHTMKFTTTNAIQTTGDTIVITFASDFNFSTKNISTVTFTHGATLGTENTESLQASADDTHWGAAFSGTQNRIFTLTAPTDGIGAAAVAASDKLIITYSATNSINAGTAGTYITTIIVSGSTSESGSFAIAILDVDSVSMTAIVDPSITFSISATSSDFGHLSTGSVTTSSPNINLVVGTNAGSGYNIQTYDTGNGANPGLYNSVAVATIGSADAAFSNTALLAGGTEGYGIQAASAASTIDARYDQSGNNVGGLEITPQNLASYATAMTSNHTITITHKAAIGSWTKAGNYNDTITYIAVGNF